MRTTVAIFVLTLFMLTPPIPAETSQNVNSSSLSNDTTPGPATSVTEMVNSSDVSTTSASTSQSHTTSPPIVATDRPVTSAEPQTQTPSLKNPINSTTVSPTVSNISKIAICVVLLAIVALMIIVGFVHRKLTTQSDEDSCVLSFLLTVRDRLRAAITNLEDRVGFQLLPRTKQGAEDANEDSEGGHEEEGCSSGVRDEEKGDCKEEDSDTSDDYSSMEGDDLREKALRRHEEEEKKQSERDDDDETSSDSEGYPSDVEGENGGDKTGGSELVQINCPQEDDETANLCDVTAL